MKTMNKLFSLKTLFIRLLLLLPLIYIGFGWYIGINYGRKAVLFGPYKDVPVVMKDSLLGSSLSEICGSNALVMVVPPSEYGKPDQDSTYFKITGYFEVPGAWNFDFTPLGTDSGLKKTFVLTGSYSRAIAHELKNPERKLGYYSVDELESFLKSIGRTRDLKKLKPYLILARLEKKYPWAYSDTVLLSPIMGNIFSDKQRPYDVLGLFGLAVLLVALTTGSFRLWMYYFYWVLAYWFGRIGFHDPNLIFNKEGQNVILWSFWNGFIQKEGRLFLVIAVGLSVAVFVILGLMYVATQAVSLLRKES